jgi:hypothetical protein
MMITITDVCDFLFLYRLSYHGHFPMQEPLIAVAAELAG